MDSDKEIEPSWLKDEPLAVRKMGAMTLSKLKAMERAAFKALNLHRPTPLPPINCLKEWRNTCNITDVEDLKRMHNTHALYLPHSIFSNRQCVLLSTLRNGENSVVLLYMRAIINKNKLIDEKLVVYKFPPDVKPHVVKMLARRLYRTPIYLGIFRLSGYGSAVKLSVEHHKFNVK